MSFNKKPSQSKSDSRVTEVLRQYPRTKIESNNSRLISTNQISIQTRNLNQKIIEQKQNKENTRYNNIIDKSQKENNVRYNNNNYLPKNDVKDNVNKNPNVYNNKNEPKKVYKFDISKYRNKNKNKTENIDDTKINKDNPMSKSENIDKNKIENINNDTNKRNINNNTLKNNKDNNENKFKLNLNKYTFVYNKGTEPIKTPRIKISDVINKNNNSASYYNNYSQKTNIVPSKRSRINPPIKIIETEPSDRRNNKTNDSSGINKNNSFSSGLNLLYPKDKSEKQSPAIPTIPHISLKHINIPQPKDMVHQNKNKSSNYLLGENQKKERAHSSYKNSNIYLKNNIISNQKEETDNEKNKNAITRVVSHRKNSYKNTSINNNKNNDNQNDKKNPTYNIIEVTNDKEEKKEKEVKTDSNKNNNIIQRKEEKVYISKKPQINNNIKDNKENNNVAFTYISNVKKISNKKNSTNNTNVNTNSQNKNETNNFSSNNNSITYIKTSSNKKEKFKDKDENLLLNKSDKKPEVIQQPKNLNNYYPSLNNNDDIKKDDINNKLENNININSTSENNNIENDKKESKENEFLISKNESQLDNNISEKESNENNITPLKSINIIDTIQNNDSNINQYNNINKLIDNNNSSLKSLSSSKKLEQKIKDLESKLDDLNNNTTSAFNISEPIDIDYDYKYSILNNQGLSDITRAYLSSFLGESIPKTELSDFSKAYMIKLDDYNANIERPTLSGLTKEFLKENDDDKDKKEEINEIKQEDNIQ